MKNKLITKTLTLALISLSINLNLQAQMAGGTTIDSVNSEFFNWHNLDPELDKTMGASVEKSYKLLLNNKTPKKEIIVAVIDGGVDIGHEDLQNRIWTNKDEIPDNNIDDDHNGYIDDIYGWNFLGNISGKNINYENYEFVRIVAEYKEQYDSLQSTTLLDSVQKVEYALYNACKERYNNELQAKELSKINATEFKTLLDSLINIIEPYAKTNTPSYSQIKALKIKNKLEKDAKKRLLKLYKYGITPEFIKNYSAYIQEYLDYYYNIDLNARSIIGDDRNDFGDAFYGNNNVKGTDAGHGTFVAGIIAANRNNDIGIDGVSNHVKIMALRTIPNGDEYDKDVALSIKYAVDNGAHIINMSFGKDYSPNKQMVDQAIKYAEENGVLLIHAAGNNSDDNDIITHYPDHVLNNGKVINNWITVGASSRNADKELPGIFSNYGQTTVDIFGPGVDIVSTSPESKYNKADGTSFSCPLVSGVAALVWSYYPELSASELKSILLESTYTYSKNVLVPNTKTRKREKANFSTLSVSGGIVNAFNALELAEQRVNN